MSTKIDDTLHLKNFINDVNRADNSRQKTVQIDIETAKRLRNALTNLLLDIVAVKTNKPNTTNDVTDVNMDGGTFK
jgi:hypothetical protein